MSTTRRGALAARFALGLGMGLPVWLALALPVRAQSQAPVLEPERIYVLH